MPQKTSIYNLEYLQYSDNGSAAMDYRRFVTLDYNMQSYVGVVGVGIIDGWTIESTTGLNVQILPGKGIINGYFAESPYTVKQRSDMVSGDREIEVLNEDDIPELPLTSSQRTKYVSIVRLYNPSFNPEGDIENSYVKVVVPYVITLFDNTDTYIYADLPSVEPSGNGYYPRLSAAEDYPSPVGAPPQRTAYTSYDEYSTAMDIYNAELANIHSYEWYMYDGNRFTEVNFSTSGAYNVMTTKILIGRVVTRSGHVTAIDVSKVDSVANMQSTIKKVAAEYITGHQHGGSNPYDPPKIKLETDIRDSILSNYNNGVATYLVTERNDTSISLAHKHTYTIDSSGSGQTLEIIGSIDPHFHKISNSIVGTQEITISNVVSHTHTISAVSSSDIWTDNSSYIVYVNDQPFADETTSYVQVNPTTKKIVFTKGISVLNNKYSSTFSMALMNPDGSTFTNVIYTYSSREVSIYNFMLKMAADYNAKYSGFYTIITTDKGATNSSAVLYNIQNHPFVFVTSDANSNPIGFAGLADLQLQSTSAQSLLNIVGDVFTFTPDAARNITVALVELGWVDKVEIEILGNTEVTGKLGTDSILFVNANKILLGKISIDRIPFISHAGRLNETFLPLQYGMYSNDGIRYTVVPAITDIALDHYHTISVDTSINGVTTNVMVGNEPVYYETDANQNTYFISHAHGVINASVASSSSDGLMQWVNNVNSSNLTSSIHTHNIVYPVVGNNKSIYSIKEDISGNIYVGTSDGLLMIPSDACYEFVINNLKFYSYGIDFWNTFKIASSQYELQTKNSLLLNDDTKKQMAELAITLISENDSFYISINNYPNRPSDQVMVKKISSFKLPNFGYTETKKLYDILPYETIVSYVGNSSSSTTTSNAVSVVVTRDYNDIPIWSIALNNTIAPSQSYVSSSTGVDVFVVGSDIAAKSINLNSTPYQSWQSVSLPISVGVARKVIKDYNKNYWVCTNNGVLVSRGYTNGNNLILTNFPAGQPDILDIEEGEIGSIYCASRSGIYKTTDGGKDWLQVQDVIGGFQQIIRDRTLDRTDSLLAHYHKYEVDIEGNGFLGESMGSGVVHIHSVQSWQVDLTLGHTHALKVTMYSLDNSNIIWRSQNNGKTWKRHGLLPDGECGDIFASFGNLFVSQEDGLYRSIDGNSWSKVLSSKVYSYDWVYEVTGFFVGCDNALYNTFDGSSFELVYQFSGNPSTILIQNGVKKNFKYAYSNFAQTFHFKNILVNPTNLTSLVDFEKWYAQNGKWDSNILYDIYVNNKLTLSAKDGVDNRSKYGYNFQVIPSNGLVDFGANTNLIAMANVYDISITVGDITNFNAYDNIVIISNDQPYHTTIDSISGNNLNLSERLDTQLTLPATVSKLVSLDGSSTVSGNIYNTLLSNIGKLTHDEIEDGLALYSDFRPYKFNDTYLSNLLQLTQATRYVYPDINSEFVNDKFYDFRYSWNPSDPLYPSIYKYIDVVTSDVYNQKSYDSNFIPKKSKSINKILIGYGSFEGLIFAATDIGVFWAKIEADYEANWFYISDIPYSVYDLIIFGTDTLIAATQNGTYTSTDGMIWTLQTNPAIDYTSYCLGLRWVNKGAIITPTHTATFTNNLISGNVVSGTITASIDTPYSSFILNQGIQVSGANDKNGNYIVMAIGGTSYGSQITVSPPFSGSTEILSGVVITMGTWWGQWNGDLNTSNSDITNTLLVGGASHISYNNGGNVWSWYESTFDIENFTAKKLLPLTSGRILCAASSSNVVSESFLLKSDDVGSNWTTLENFEEITGDIVLSSLSDFNNTILTVNYLTPDNVEFQDGIMDQLDIDIFIQGNTIASYRGKVIGNQQINGTYTITIYGNGANNVFNNNNSFNFVIYPTKINTMVETSQQTLLYGTNRGIYTDVNSVASNVHPQGTILGAGILGKVTAIDISGQIIGLSYGSNGNTTNLSLVSNTVIRGSDVTGKTMYITDTNPVESYVIANNDSMAPEDEAVIVLNTKLDSSYIGKKVRIVGDSSRVYLDWNLPVLANEFNNGTIYIVSDEANNRGSSYTVSSNGTNYIDLDTVIIPSSTLIYVSTETIDTTSLSNQSLQIGQTIIPFDSGNKLTLWVSLDRAIKENDLAGLNLTMLGNISSIVTTFEIYSNEKNNITLSPVKDIVELSMFIFSDLAIGKGFIIKDSLFQQLGGFSHLLTSVDSGHYHNAQMLNNIASGVVSSFNYVDSSYVNFSISNTTNFDINDNLLDGAKIIFTNPASINLIYSSQVVSHTPTNISVKLESPSYWNFDNYDTAKVSSGWTWEIDATNYGYTGNPIYSDFNVLDVGVTVTIDPSSDMVMVSSTVGMIVDDKIRIQDDTLSYEFNSVKQIINSTTIKVSTLPSRTYFIQRNPQIKVLRDIFTNTHIHQIRNNEVETLTISDYLNNGYPAQHSHMVLPLIEDVSNLLNQDNRIIAMGSSSKLYNSYNNGSTWQEIVDLNNFLEGSSEISGVSTGILYNNKMIIGATNGNIFVQSDNSSQVVDLEKP